MRESVVSGGTSGAEPHETRRRILSAVLELRGFAAVWGDYNRTFGKFFVAGVTMRIAVIDIGSNSIRLVAADLHGSDYVTCADLRATPRLGRGLAATGMLDQASMDAALEVLSNFQQQVRHLRVDALRIVATCALREAANGPEFLRRVQETLGLSIEVLTAHDEGRLAFLSVQRRCDCMGRRTLVADVGGGSTEIVLAFDRHIEHIATTRLGAVRLAAMFDGASPMTDAQYAKMIAWIDEELDRETSRIELPVDELHGCGGAFTSLGAMVVAGTGDTAPIDVVRAPQGML
ncbi:MAG: hypothetical protein KDA61_03255, partial [Planctomycetales bacterium]|nr:hypothetical protein [Planctomycetales bacterium]